jgi:hypothetical protein
MSAQLAATRRWIASVLCSTALLGVASACGSPKNIPLAFIPGSDAGDAAASDAAVSDVAVGDAGLHQPCSSAADCMPGTVCLMAPTVCDAGTCEQAVSCSDTSYNPQCGCNMVTYLNNCELLKAGVGLKAPTQCGVFSAIVDAGATGGGAMGQCDVRTNAGCTNGTICAGLYPLPRGVCSSDFAAPSCWAIPESCSSPLRFDPCGSGESCVDSCKAITKGGLYQLGACELPQPSRP